MATRGQANGGGTAAASAGSAERQRAAQRARPWPWRDRPEGAPTLDSSTSYTKEGLKKLSNDELKELFDAIDRSKEGAVCYEDLVWAICEYQAFALTAVQVTSPPR